MIKPNLKVDWATHEAARHACENWHYSRCLPAGKLVKVGAWEDERFIGVVLFGRGASPTLGVKFNLSQDQCVELVRVAMQNHKTTISRIISISLRFLQKSNPRLRLIVSFADPDKGHAGGIYQAGNWIYCGKSPETKELFVKGKWVHWRGGFYSKTKTTPQRTMPGKHRYLMPLDAEMKKRILPLSKPYPKRAGSDTTDTAGFQPAEGGSIPTPALPSLA